MCREKLGNATHRTNKLGIQLILGTNIPKQVAAEPKLQKRARGPLFTCKYDRKTKTEDHLAKDQCMIVIEHE